MNIYHNPRWSKSRKALEILQDEGVNIIVVDYLKTPINEKQIKLLLSKLDIPASDLIRKNNSLYRGLGVDLENKDDIISNLADFPELLERPIVETEDKAVIGRPPENVYKLL